MATNYRTNSLAAEIKWTTSTWTEPTPEIGEIERKILAYETRLTYVELHSENYTHISESGGQQTLDEKNEKWKADHSTLNPIIT